MTAPPNAPYVYRASSGAAPWLFFAGGVGLVLVAVFGFLTTLYGRGGMIGLHLTSTLPMIVAVGLFAAGYRLARAPREVSRCS